MTQHFKSIEKLRQEKGEFTLICNSDTDVLLTTFKQYRISISATREKKFMDDMTAPERILMLVTYAKFFVKKGWLESMELLRRVREMFVETDDPEASTLRYTKNRIYYVVDLLHAFRDIFHAFNLQWQQIRSWLPPKMITSGKEVVRGGGQNGQNKNGQGGRNGNSTDTDQGSNKASGNNGDKPCCWYCGRNNHVTAKCDSQSWEGIEKDVKQQRAYLNKEKCPYADSERGKACMAKFGVRYIPNLAWVISENGDLVRTPYGVGTVLSFDSKFDLYEVDLDWRPLDLQIAEHKEREARYRDKKNDDDAPKLLARAEDSGPTLLETVEEASEDEEEPSSSGNTNRNQGDDFVSSPTHSIDMSQSVRDEQVGIDKSCISTDDTSIQTTLFRSCTQAYSE